MASFTKAVKPVRFHRPLAGFYNFAHCLELADQQVRPDRSFGVWLCDPALHDQIA